MTAANDASPPSSAGPGARPGPSRALPAWPRRRLAALRRFEAPSAARAAWQLANTLLPYLGALALMVVTLRRGLPWWTTALLGVLASGFMVRLFILFHDCVHASFLPSDRAGRVVGRILGVLVFTPFGEWRRSHLGHHATSGDLDRRDLGDVWTMTVEEYAAAPRRKRFSYRVTRHPALMLLVGPLLVFLVNNRFPPRGGTRARVLSVLSTDLALAAIATAASLTIGLGTFLLVQIPVLFLAGVWGIWLFYVQHQFERAYWVRGEVWDPLQAALAGSSYFKLPRVLQWFSGNIGLHHVHHLRPRIPNYHLQRCLDATPELQAVRPLTLAGSLRCGRLALWDERAGDFVGFDAVPRPSAAPAGS
ncbi:fatty acid desaturase [Anaeromyxobacter diazotrophicus]|uniref:Fatty acid desaturase n=1 Tax=Anaeromyxobacter diazotrophicus TaxID=2590199 RepID=A0A7I9VSR9_9BACT|nr:fatty acid desaturase [Anaeromyxobacter diazotrophicus]GEJ59129.1 fatty acid desaturase [Anaeromyxobacter diazotrophicus]